MFELIHNSIISSFNFNKIFVNCNICIGLLDLNRKSFPDANHFHYRNCILGLNINWFKNDNNSLMLSNFFNIVSQQHRINPTETSSYYLKFIKGGGKVLLYWTLNELLKLNCIKKEQIITLEINNTNANEEIQSLIHYYKLLGFISSFNLESKKSYVEGSNIEMHSTVENILSTIDIESIITEMNTFYSFLQTQTIHIHQ